MLYRITTAEARPDCRLWIRFSDGTEGEVDVSGHRARPQQILVTAERTSSRRLTYRRITSMSLCMRTTVRLPDDLLRAAKIHAAESGRTLTAFIEEALRAALATTERAEAETVSLPTYGSGGPRPGIDLDDSAALLEAMEEAG